MATSTDSVSRFARSSRWATLALLIAAGLEFLDGLGGLPILAGDLGDIPGPGLGGAIIITTIILRPIFAAATVFAAGRGHTTAALFAMAVVILLNWAAYLPSVQRHGWGLDGGTVGAIAAVIILILPPVVAVVVSGLALLQKHLTLAALLAILPTLIGILSAVAFGIGIAMYGF